jgi:hypothetical protein
MSYADLHVHTLFSDGTDTPFEVIGKAAAAGLSAISLVDHDSVEGYCSVKDSTGTEKMELISGIELTAEYGLLEIHVLGYFIDVENSALRNKLLELKANRIERVRQMIVLLKDKMNVSLNIKTVFDLAGFGTVSRLHVARAMVKEGIVSSSFEAFQKYIGNNCPAYVLGFKFSVSEAVDLILQAGGIPILAHPYSLRNNDIIVKLLGFGIKGLEVYYLEHTHSMTQAYLQFCKENDLFVSGGSDYHGYAKPDVKLGDMRIPYELVERLRYGKR